MSTRRAAYDSISKNSVLSVPSLYSQRDTESHELDEGSDGHLNSSAYRRVLGRRSIEARRISSMKLYDCVLSSESTALAAMAAATSVTRSPPPPVLPPKDFFVTSLPDTGMTDTFGIDSRCSSYSTVADQAISSDVLRSMKTSLCLDDHDEAETMPSPPFGPQLVPPLPVWRTRRPSTITEHQTPTKHAAKSKFSHSPASRKTRKVDRSPANDRRQKRISITSKRSHEYSNASPRLHFHDDARLRSFHTANAGEKKRSAKKQGSFNNLIRMMSKDRISTGDVESDAKVGQAKAVEDAESTPRSHAASKPAKFRNVSLFDTKLLMPHLNRQEADGYPKAVATPCRASKSTANKRDTITERGSWIEIKDIVCEVATEKNGRSRRWWPWSKKAKHREAECSRMASVDEEENVRLSTTSRKSFLISRPSFLHPKRDGSKTESLADPTIDNPVVVDRGALSPRPRSKSSNILLDSRSFANPTPPPVEPLPTISTLPPLRPLQLMPVSTTLRESAEDKVKEDRSTRASRRNLSLPLPYILHPCATEASSMLQVYPPSSEENTQRTIGSSILFIDEDLKVPSRHGTPQARRIEKRFDSLAALSPGRATELLLDLMQRYRSETSLASSLSACTGDTSTINFPQGTSHQVNGMLSPPQLFQPPLTSRRPRRGTCTTMETILTYQSSFDSASDASALCTILSDAEALNDETTVMDVEDQRSVLNSVLEDLIEGVQSNALSPTSNQKVCRARSISSKSTSRMTKTKRQPSRKASVRTNSEAQAENKLAWPEHRDDSGIRSPFEKGDGRITMFGAELVANELRLTAHGVESSPCPSSRVFSRFGAASSNASGSSRPRKSSSELDLTKRSLSSFTNSLGDVTVANALVPEVTFTLGRTIKISLTKRSIPNNASGQGAVIKEVGTLRSDYTGLYHNRKDAHDANQSMPSDADVRNAPPPTICIERPLSDSSLSQSLCDDSIGTIEEAQVQHASRARMSSVSKMNYASVAMGQIMCKQERMRQESLRSEQSQHRPHRLNRSKCSSSTQYSSLADSTSSPHSPASNHPWSDMSNSFGFGWSEGRKRLSSGTSLTIPSPGMKSDTSGKHIMRRATTAKETANRLIDPFLDEAVQWPAQVVRTSTKRFPDSPYSISIMTIFDSPKTLLEVDSFLHQSRSAFVSLDDAAAPTQCPRTVEVVEGRESLKGRLGQVRRRVNRLRGVAMSCDRSVNDYKKARRTNTTSESITSLGDDSGDAEQALEDIKGDSDGMLDESSILSQTFPFVDCQDVRHPTQSSPVAPHPREPQRSPSLASLLHSAPPSPLPSSSVSFSSSSTSDASFQSTLQSSVWSPPTHFIPLNASTLSMAQVGHANGQHSQHPTSVRSSVVIVVQSPSTESHSSLQS